MMKLGATFTTFSTSDASNGSIVRVKSRGVT